MSDEEPTLDEQGSVPHRALIPMYGLIVVASVLTAFRGDDLLLKMFAVAAWLFALAAMLAAGVHDWKACTLCDGPPARVATVEARAKLARKTHNRWRKGISRLVMALFLTHALGPKTYMEQVDGWWRLVPAAVYLLMAVWTAGELVTIARHHEVRDECHVERCRTEAKRMPNAFQRWLAHYGLWLMLPIIPATVTLGVFALDHSANYQFGYAMALCVVIYMMIMMQLYHVDIPCLICAGNPPHNGGELAEKRTRWLHLSHRLKGFGPGIVIGLWVSSWVASGTATGRVLVGMAGLLVLFLTILSRVHGRVQPWCPWCRDDGGDEAEADAPDPSTTQPVPA